MKRLLFSLMVCCFISLCASGQETAPVRIGFESGFNSFDNTMRDISLIRKYSADFGYDDYGESSIGIFETYFTGLRFEWPVTRKLMFSSGLRYTRVRSALRPGEKDAMYLLLSSEGNTTEYLRASSITENSDYLGIPLEAKFYTSSYHFVRFFLKAGAVFNYRVNTSYQINFTDGSMGQYERQMTSKFSEPGPYNAIIYGGCGLSIGRANYATMNIELICPSFVVSPNPSALTKPLAGGGVAVTVLLPLKFKTREQ